MLIFLAQSVEPRAVFPNLCWFAAPLLSIVDIWRALLDGEIGTKINEFY